MDDLELGARISYWRERRGMTQRLFADRIGRSKSWVEKVEAGTRSANKLPVLLTICKELRLDLPVLIGRDLDRDTREGIGDSQVESIRSALERYDVTRDGLDGDYAPDIRRLRRQLSYAWSAFEQADYHVVSQALPTLLLETQRGNVAAEGIETTSILIEVYQITASTLRKLGEYDLAWLAGDRGFALADRLGDHIATALIGFRVANALTALGRSRAAFDLNISLSSRVEPNIRTDADASVYGTLLLQAAMAASNEGNAIVVRDLVREASSIASRVPNNADHHRLSFNKTNVGIHHVSALVSLGEGGLATEVAAKMDENGIRLMRRERRANHLIDVARGYSQWAKRDEALEALLIAEALAPREVLARPIARSTIENLLKRSRGQAPASLRSLAQRAGVES